MKLTLVLLLALGAQASWFGSDTPAYQQWDTQQLTTWLKEHNVPVPSDAPSQAQLQDLVKENWAAAQAYGADQYHAAQHSFQGLKDSAFETWDESTLRQFLLDQGVIEPKGPREQLVQLAKSRYRDYQSAASSLSYAASTGVYGSPAHQATQSLSSAVAQATADVSRKVDDSKDYVWSTWDDNRLRTFLEEKGIIKTKQQASRDEMIKLAKTYYSKATSSVYETWSDSYIHQWLLDHQIPPYNTAPPPRASLLERMQWYYYDVTQKVWNTWSDSQLKEWLVEHNVIRSDAHIKRDKLEKMVADNYLTAEDTVWSAWRDSDIRNWLVENGYAAQAEAAKTRKDLVKAINSKYREATSAPSEYLVWPDARLRAFLREHGLPEDSLPTSRPGLLQEARIRYTQASTHTDALYQRIIDLLSSGIHIAEDKLWQILDILTGTKNHAKEQAKGAQAWSDAQSKEAKASVSSATSKAKDKTKTEL
ncbi:hypothetical protein BC834DRAFT_862331 [Gloeopeniophorella convolvens]|nr:hypothetical protein BC834DRAFT_862331 [Gloeopeniophorella convolvens]